MLILKIFVLKMSKGYTEIVEKITGTFDLIGPVAQLGR